jgi:hypothetical protein
MYERFLVALFLALCTHNFEWSHAALSAPLGLWSDTLMTLQDLHRFVFLARVIYQGKHRDSSTQCEQRCAWTQDRSSKSDDMEARG